MRDFRDAKAMARTLRAALAAKGLRITISESLELIAQAFGVADWNTLSAAIRAEGPTRPESASPPPPPTAESVARPRFSVELEATLHRALAYASKRKHEYATLEHLLLALIKDVDASAVMKACEVNLGALNEHLRATSTTTLKNCSSPTAASPN
jgi:Glyoxalase superfamily protein/Clp amino terminal domain, pathogenicity island component